MNRHEQQRLDEVARALAEDDPSLHGRLARPPMSAPGRFGPPALALFGLLEVVAGIGSWSAPLMIVGVCAVVIASVWRDYAEQRVGPVPEAASRR